MTYLAFKYGSSAMDMLQASMPSVAAMRKRVLLQLKLTGIFIDLAVITAIYFITK